jgi:hypothetical protein
MEDWIINNEANYLDRGKINIFSKLYFGKEKD